MPRSQFQWKDRIALVAGILIFCGLALAFRLTLITRDEPWFISVLKIDGPSYIKGMEAIAASGDFLNLADIYHSPGYQMYIGVIDLLYPFDRGLFFGLKALSVLYFLGTIAITVHLGERYFHRHAGWIAGAVLALSLDWQVYANLLQGEVLQGFCFALFTWIVVREVSREVRGEDAKTDMAAHSGPRAPVVVAASMLATFLTLLQVRYFPLVPLAAAALLLRPASGRVGPRRNWRAGILFLAPCLILLGGWSSYHSQREGRALFVGTGSEFRMRVAYNPNATGASYPYPEIVEPTGLRFVLSNPGRTAWLLRQRFLYLWNWKRDIWDLGNPVSMHRDRLIVRSPFEIPFHVGGTILFAVGVVLRLRTGGTGKRRAHADIWLYVWTLAVVAGPLLVFASSRFLIPALPVVALFQAYAALAIIGSRLR